MVDMDPASDVEREPGGTVKLERKEIHSESMENKAAGSKKKRTKAVAIKAPRAEGEGPTVSSIIEEKPAKKMICDFLRMRISQLMMEDSD